MNKCAKLLIFLLSLATAMGSLEPTFLSKYNLEKAPELLTNGNRTCSNQPRYYTFFTDLEILQIVPSLEGQSLPIQMSFMKNLFLSTPKMFTPSQIVTLLNIVCPYQNDIAKTQFFLLLKPYIPAMQSLDAAKILKSLPINTTVIQSIIQMICNIDVNDFSFLGDQLDYFNKYYFSESSQNWRYFFISFEGKYATYLIDSSNSMFEPVLVTSGPYSRIQNRFQFLMDFYQLAGEFGNVDDTFSTLFSNNNSIVPTPIYHEQFYRSHYQKTTGDGETNLYSALEQLLQFSYDGMSDIFIISDGIVTEGNQDLYSFKSLIQNSNDQRKYKVRVNAINTYISSTPNERPNQRSQGAELLKAIAAYGDGTYLEIIPYW